MNELVIAAAAWVAGMMWLFAKLDKPKWPLMFAAAPGLQAIGAGIGLREAPIVGLGLALLPLGLIVLTPFISWPSSSSDADINRLLFGVLIGVVLACTVVWIWWIALIGYAVALLALGALLWKTK